MSYGNQNKPHYETKIYFYNVFILCFMVINLVIWDTSKGYHMTQINGRSSSPGKNNEILNSLFEQAKTLCGNLNNYVSVIVRFMGKKILDTFYN